MTDTTAIASIPLPDLPRRLAELTGCPAPSYRRCYTLALDATLPTEKVRGRHYVAERDLPGIADILGMKPARRSAVAA